MTQWQTKPTKVKAEQMTECGLIITGSEGRGQSFAHIPYEEEFKPGDWIVQTPNGLKRVWTDKDFRESYEPVEKKVFVVMVRCRDNVSVDSVAMTAEAANRRIAQDDEDDDSIQVWTEEVDLITE